MKAEDFEVLRELKANDFGQVLLVKNPKGKVVILKRIDSLAVCPDFLKNEIAAAETLRHGKIVRFLATFEEDYSHYIVMEHINGRDLYEEMQERNFASFKESEVKIIFRQLIKALLYCHSKGFVHRDLKLENVMISKGLRVKLLDFGLCMAAPCSSLGEKWCGSPDYACPEILARTPYCGCKADVWSAGVILYSLLFSELPFDFQHRAKAILKKLPHPPLILPKKDISLQLEDLLYKMICPDPQTRLTMEEVAAHPWVRKPSLVDALFRSSIKSLPKLPAPRADTPIKSSPCRYASPKKTVGSLGSFSPRKSPLSPSPQKKSSQGKSPVVRRIF